VPEPDCVQRNRNALQSPTADVATVKLACLQVPSGVTVRDPRAVAPSISEQVWLGGLLPVLTTVPLLTRAYLQRTTTSPAIGTAAVGSATVSVALLTLLPP
jgi:hypothetical protein